MTAFQQLANPNCGTVNNPAARN